MIEDVLWIEHGHGWERKEMWRGMTKFECTSCKPLGLDRWRTGRERARSIDSRYVKMLLYLEHPSFCGTHNTLRYCSRACPCSLAAVLVNAAGIQLVATTMSKWASLHSLKVFCHMTRQVSCTVQQQDPCGNATHIDIHLIVDDASASSSCAR